MIDTEVEFEQKVEEIATAVVLKMMKKAGIPMDTMQTTLTPDDVILNESLEEYMQDKQCLVWLGSNERGAKQGVQCNQFYISKQGSMSVDESLPLTFEEVFDIWEAHFKNHPVEHIYYNVLGAKEEVNLSDIRLVIWALLHGKCNYVLDFIREDRYPFDFKKYAGRF